MPTSFTSFWYLEGNSLPSKTLYNVSVSFSDVVFIKLKKSLSIPD